MKKVLMMVVAAMMATTNINGQTDFTGRVYKCDNILAGEFTDVNKKLADARKKAIEKKEKEKGRKLTANELKEVDENMKKAEAKIKAVAAGTKTSISIAFKSAKEMKMAVKMKVSDEAMKEAGIGWAKRQAMKAAMAIMPAMTVDYTIKNNLLIYRDEDETDTLRISPDGKYLYGVYKGNKKEKEKDIKYTLTRTK